MLRHYRIVQTHLITYVLVRSIWELLVKYYDGDVAKALMAYNGGAGNVDKGSPSSASQEYAAALLGTKKDSGLIPQKSDAAGDKELDRMLAALLASPKTPKARSTRPDFKRFRKSSRMSPLSGSSDPMRKMMQQADDARWY